VKKRRRAISDFIVVDMFANYVTGRGTSRRDQDAERQAQRIYR